MRDWMEGGYSLGDTRSKAERRADRQRAMANSGLSWRATRRLRE